MAAGPLNGVRVVEFAAIGPGPYCATLLADLGADVVRVTRKGDPPAPAVDVHARGRRSVPLDLKNPDDRGACLALLVRADVLIEGFRPGVMERLGLAPATVHAIRPALVYGRVTGWGQDGPLASSAGHDINYIAVAGALAGIGPADGPPVPPLSLVGDFAAGSLVLAFGIVAALLEARSSGRGQVVDASMCDGATSLMSFMTYAVGAGITTARRGRNLLDGACHYYRCYRCADGLWIAVGAVEPQFYAALMDVLDIPRDERPRQDEADWREGSALFERVFAMRSREEWCTRAAGRDACLAPVLEFEEASLHPHLRARRTFVDVDGVTQPAPIPRFSRTPGAIQGPPPARHTSIAEVIDAWSATSAACRP